MYILEPPIPHTMGSSILSNISRMYLWGLKQNKEGDEMKLYNKKTSIYLTEDDYLMLEELRKVVKVQDIFRNAIKREYKKKLEA